MNDIFFGNYGKSKNETGLACLRCTLKTYMDGAILTGVWDGE